MTSHHHVAIAWEGSEDESLPLLSILRSEGYVFSVQEEEGRIRIEVEIENESSRQLRDDVDALLVHFSSLED
jgi:DNA-binding PadR family transcriptional regulator